MKARAREASGVALRPEIRALMAHAPRRKWTLEAMHRALAAQFEGLSVEAVEQALRWNHARGLVDFEFSGELETDFWYLTQRGQNTP